MKRVMALALPVLLLFGGSLAAVELLHDRELFVSPPDAAAEGFIREVMTKRYSRAKEYLADPESVSQAELEELQSRLGEGENPEAKIVARDDEHAGVDVKVKETVFSVPLEWDRGWKVALLP